MTINIHNLFVYASFGSGQYSTISLHIIFMCYEKTGTLKACFYLDCTVYQFYGLEGLNLAHFDFFIPPKLLAKET